MFTCVLKFLYEYIFIKRTYYSSMFQNIFHKERYPSLARPRIYLLPCHLAIHSS
jgi:hypothetical protein